MNEWLEKVLKDTWHSYLVQPHELLLWWGHQCIITKSVKEKKKEPKENRLDYSLILIAQIIQETKLS